MFLLCFRELYVVYVSSESIIGNNKEEDLVGFYLKVKNFDLVLLLKNSTVDLASFLSIK